MIHTLFLKYGTKKSNMVLLSFVFVCILMVGCTEETQEVKPEESVTTEDVNIQTVEAVLALELTAPDKEYHRLIENVGPVSENLPEAEREKMDAKYKKIESHIRSKYKPYFTPKGLEGFLFATPAYQFQYQSANYQLSIQEMEVKQSDNKNASNQYSFTAQVALESRNIEKELYEVIGKAIFSEEGKIGRIQIADKDQLLSTRLNELSNLD